MTEQLDLFIRLGVALGIGFLIGLQREYAYGGEGRSIIAGDRTFSLIGLSGFMAAMLSETVGSPNVLMAVLFLIGALVTSGHLVKVWEKERVGITTEVSILIAVLVGALCYYDYLVLAVAIGIITTVMLSLKIETDRFVETLTEKDISAALQLAVISAIVLPVLPNQGFWPAPFDVLNPFKIWLMVVFISGISFFGYALIKIIGSGRGIVLTGFLGGIVSSTALTLSFSQRSKQEHDLTHRLGLAIIFSWAVMYVRIIIEVAVLNLPLLSIIWLPITITGFSAVVYGSYLQIVDRRKGSLDLEFDNPFDLGSAIRFGVLYAVILLISRAVQGLYGDPGVFISSLIGGTASMNAVTLSLAELSLPSGGLDLAVAAKSLIYASLTSTLVKGGFVFFAGSKILRKVIFPGLALILFNGIVLSFFI
ncbi:MAG: MgtC/SapB family protein [Anaerolineae bacterium]|nr:MgtC/SapB family protein [Anaerolineae bacterium]